MAVLSGLRLICARCQSRRSRLPRDSRAGPGTGATSAWSPLLEVVTTPKRSLRVRPLYRGRLLEPGLDCVVGDRGQGSAHHVRGERPDQPPVAGELAVCRSAGGGGAALVGQQCPVRAVRSDREVAGDLAPARLAERGELACGTSRHSMLDCQNFPTAPKATSSSFRSPSESQPGRPTPRAAKPGRRRLLTVTQPVGQAADEHRSTDQRCVYREEVQVSGSLEGRGQGRRRPRGVRSPRRRRRASVRRGAFSRGPCLRTSILIRPRAGHGRQRRRSRRVRRSGEELRSVEQAADRSPREPTAAGWRVSSRDREDIPTRWRRAVRVPASGQRRPPPVWMAWRCRRIRLPAGPMVIVPPNAGEAR